MTKTIAIVSEKGGIAKTATCFALGGEFARRGRSVLLLDLDPQGSLTASFHLDGCAGATTLAIFGAQMVPAEEMVTPTRFAGLFLARGDRALKPINCWQPSMPEYVAGQFAVRDFINDLGSRFERILIDGPPGLEFCAWCALTGADYVLTPTFAEPDGDRAIRFTNQEIARVQGSVNPGLAHLGIVLGNHKKNKIHAAYAAGLRDEFPGLVFQQEIPHAAAIIQARHARTPIGFFRPKGEPARAVAGVVDEIERRLEFRQLPAEAA